MACVWSPRGYGRRPRNQLRLWSDRPTGVAVGGRARSAGRDSLGPAFHSPPEQIHRVLPVDGGFTAGCPTDRTGTGFENLDTADTALLLPFRPFSFRKRLRFPLGSAAGTISLWTHRRSSAPLN